MDDDEADPNALKNVEADRILYMAFTKTLKYYDVKFYNGTTLLETQNIGYGGTAYYSGGEPERTDAGSPDDWEFIGWSPAPTNITGATSCYAQYEFVGSYARALVQRTLKDYTNTTITAATGSVNYALAGLNMDTVRFTALASTRHIFYQATIKTLILDSLLTVNGYDFESANLTRLVLPSATTLNNGWNGTKFNATTVDLYVVETIGSFGNNFNNRAMDVIIRRTSGVCSLTAAPSGASKLYVPRRLDDGSDGVEAYKSATNWSSMSDRIFAIEDYPDICGEIVDEWR
jgi:hypothetical protein